MKLKRSRNLNPLVSTSPLHWKENGFKCASLMILCEMNFRTWWGISLFSRWANVSYHKLESFKLGKWARAWFGTQLNTGNRFLYMSLKQIDYSEAYLQAYKEWEFYFSTLYELLISYRYRHFLRPIYTVWFLLTIIACDHRLNPTLRQLCDSRTQHEKSVS